MPNIDRISVEVLPLFTLVRFSRSFGNKPLFFAEHHLSEVPSTGEQQLNKWTDNLLLFWASFEA